MAEFKKWNIGDFDGFDSETKSYLDGVFTLQLHSWVEFHAVASKSSGYPDYFWRGQSCDSSLRSSFDRSFKGGKGRSKVLQKMLATLKQRLSDVRDITSWSEPEIWAVGQHYGLKTHLLDWTASPYIAAFFAFYQKGTGQRNRVVYALNRAPKLLKRGDDRFVKFDLPNSHFDPSQNQRLERQKGRFTMALEGQDIKGVVAEFWATARKNKKHKYDNEIILAEFLVPDGNRLEALASLRAMNITHGALFPDPAGAVEITKMDLDP